METKMTKAADINEIIAMRSPELMLDALWDDPIIVGKIKAKLEKVSATNIKFYQKHFCGDIKEVKK